jgi:ubiquinone/menaquinone biosynthesis C-methylase UbiE
MYDQFASDYDRFNDWNSRLQFELPFIENTIKTVPSEKSQPLRILDAACGTGMHAIALAKRGYSVSAADLSAPMIEQARANAESAGAWVHFEAAGFGNLSNRFGDHVLEVVLCLGNSLPHILTPVALKATLEDFARCLRPGGLLLIQNRNFDAVMSEHQRWMSPSVFADEHFEYLYQRFYDFETDGTIHFNIVTLVRPRGGEWQASITSTHLAPQKRAELNKSLADAGFTRIEEFGSMGGEAFDLKSSPNLVITARTV